MKLNYFSFKEFDGKLLLTNDFGKYIFLEAADFKKLISRNFDMDSSVVKELKNKGFIYEGTELRFSEDAKWPILNAKSHLASATSLHIFVVTTSCNMNCVYCQANNGLTTPSSFMDIETAERAVDIALQSPEINLNFEFQGGEPLLNYTVIRHIVEYTEEHKNNKNISYNLVSNLTLLTEEMLDFFCIYNVSISTSIDGNESIHNMNRPFKDGGGTFARVKKKVKIIRDCGLKIGAIETTTRDALPYAKDLIKIYVDLGFSSIFIRHLTCLGKAKKEWDSIGYTAGEFLTFYRSALDELIKLNQQGIYIQEQHASIFLKRIDGQRMNYMELRSPCGGGIGQLAYFADGRIFTCDEGRMLAEMGNNAFQLGNVYESTYEQLIASSACRTVCAASTLETIPTCCDCVYQPYCGTCPVVNYALTDDIIEKEPRSFRCQVYEGMLDYLFSLMLENDQNKIDVLKRWCY